MSTRQELVLALADQYIAEAEERIAHLLQHIRHMEARGRNTADARAMLRVMEASLALVREHRQQLLAKLADDSRPE
jgi:hypothetical protein